MPKHVLVELPTGSREGVYEIAVLGRSDKTDAPDEQQVLLNSTGTTKLENHTMVLRPDAEFRNISPGSCFLGVRQPGLE